jgi:hypothetical protein
MSIDGVIPVEQLDEDRLVRGAHDRGVDWTERRPMFDVAGDGHRVSSRGAAAQARSSRVFYVVA